MKKSKNDLVVFGISILGNGSWDSAAKFYNKYGKSLVPLTVGGATVKALNSNEND